MSKTILFGLNKNQQNNMKSFQKKKNKDDLILIQKESEFKPYFILIQKIIFNLIFFLIFFNSNSRKKMPEGLIKEKEKD